MKQADSYHEALNAHRHYDTMANAALSLVGAALAGGPALFGSISKYPGSEIALIFTSLVIHIAIQTYKRFDSYAGLALNVASAIEKGDDRFMATPLGFATVFANSSEFPDLMTNGETRTFKRIRFIGYSAGLLFLIAAVTIFALRFTGAS